MLGSSWRVEVEFVFYLAECQCAKVKNFLEFLERLGDPAADRKALPVHLKMPDFIVAFMVFECEERDLSVSSSFNLLQRYPPTSSTHSKLPSCLDFSQQSIALLNRSGTV
jgi:hypothetical protein